MATDFGQRHSCTSTRLTSVSPCIPPRLPGSGNAIFEASDGTRLRFSLTFLAQLSLFFRTLTTLPAPSEDDNGLPIYTLPSASSHGLRYVFDLLLALAEGHSPLPFEVAPFEDVLIIADAYDLPLVHTWLTMKSALLLDKDPFIPYTIASLSGDRTLANTAIRKAIGRDISRMPSWAKTLLKQHAPLALIRLYELQAEHAAALESFGRKVRAADINGMGDFSDLCKGGEGCESYRASGGDWGVLKARCADMVLQAFARGGRGMESAPIKDVTLAIAWCGRCQVTLEKNCMSAWRDTLGDLATSATA